MSRRGIRIAVAGGLFVSLCVAITSGPSGFSAGQTPAGRGATVDVPVTEGTSMSVSISPDGRTLATDLQGSIWTMPATGGTMTRITDPFNDARQPNWSPDGKTITFFAYRDGGYDLWAVAADGSNQHKLTVGTFDDREPVFSHDGTRIAFSSDRGDQLGSDYNIWALDLRTGELRQLTKNPAEDFMPSWSPDDKEIAFASTRDEGASLWAVNVATGAERKVSTAAGRVDAPSWGPGGQIVYHDTLDGQSRYETEGKPLTGSENAFAFRVSWRSRTEFYYVSDGKIRKRSLNDGGAAQTIPFTATLQVTRAQYTHRKRDFDSLTPRKAVGIVHPVISPDGRKVAFAALGDIFLMNVGGKPENLTKDRFLDTDPAWSPDGSQLAYSSDKGGDLLQIWIRDMKTGQSRQLTHMTTQPQGAAWSPDGKRIAVFNVTGMWRVAEFSVIDVASGTVTKVHETLPQPGAPSWSPDGKRLAIAGSAPYSKRFREGTNQVLTMSAEREGDDRWFAPIPGLSIDSRGACGPAWSPDGLKMAAIYEGQLAVWPVTAAGEPMGPPRKLTTEIANSPSWTGDSRKILYLTMDKMKTVDVETGETREVPLDLTYTVDVPKGTLVVHAGRLVDMKSDAARSDVDIVIEGNRIKRVSPHSAAAHTGNVVDASSLTVMPGLIEWHSHLQPDYGESAGRAWLAWGVTTVQSPGGVPYEAAAERETADAGISPGPRVFNTGHLMEWQRVYYKMGIALSSMQHLEMELARAKVLQYDFLKSYVRLPDLAQKRVVEFAHGIGIRVTTHEIYPAALVGMDGTEHTSGTSRRGYSPKLATLQRSYEDVTQLLGKAGMIFSPMLAGPGAQKLYADEPALRQDPRFTLYPEWMQAQVSATGGRGGRGAAASLAGGRGSFDTGGTGKMMMDAYKAGARVVVGTDSPNAFQTHGSLMGQVLAGLTPYQALQTATTTPAEAMGLDAGSIAPGKLADLVIVDGNPLENVANAHKVKRVIANGRVYELDQLIRGTGATRTTSASR
jgi:Tol biopolymer transport system component